MKHKTWFRLVLKGIGVLLVGLSLPTLVQTLGFVAYVVDSIGSPSAAMYPDSYWMVQIAHFGGALLQFVLGLYLFFGGAWIVNKAIPSNRPYCPDCGYPLSNLSSPERCPECGAALARKPPDPQAS